MERPKNRPRISRQFGSLQPGHTKDQPSIEEMKKKITILHCQLLFALDFRNVLSASLWYDAHSTLLFRPEASNCMEEEELLLKSLQHLSLKRTSYTHVLKN